MKKIVLIASAFATLSLLALPAATPAKAQSQGFSRPYSQPCRYGCQVYRPRPTYGYDRSRCRWNCGYQRR